MKEIILLLSLVLANNVFSAITVVGNSDASICYRHAELGASSRSSISICRASLADKSLSKDLIAATRVNLGIIYNNASKPQLAMGQFNLALLNESAKPEALLNQGNSFFILKNFSVALEKYQSSLLSNIEDVSAVYFNIGLAYERTGKIKEAISYYSKSVKHTPNFILALQAKERLLQASILNKPVDKF